MISIKLDVADEKKDEITSILNQLGITVSDDAPFLISENLDYTTITVSKNDNLYKILVKDIIYIESQNHDLMIKTLKDTYKTRQTINYFEKHLPTNFIRVHRSFIINKDMIDFIKPILGMQFNLRMTNKDYINVSRTYYYQFKEKIGI